MFLNVKPFPIYRIPWGWENERTPHGVFVTNPPGAIKMPNLVSAFDWNRFEVELPPESWDQGVPTTDLGTMDMKSIFTTAVRFLGWEAAWIGLEYEHLDLTPITEGFVAWNKKLLKSFRGAIKYFMIGDDYGYNNGLVISPEAWVKGVKPHLKVLIDLAKGFDCTVILHTDGDVWKLLYDFIDLGIDMLNYQPVGMMKSLDPESRFCGMKLWKNIPEFDIKS